jgi:hypothetical protein
VYQNYFLDALMLRFGRIDDGVLAFGRPTGRDFIPAGASTPE